MDYTIDEINYKGYTIKIKPDENSESPRDWDNLGTMVCNHRNYMLGDKQIPELFYDDNGNEHYIETWKDVEAWIGKDIAVILPPYLYDHSGITMYTSNDSNYHQHEGWDSSMVGLCYATKEQVRKEFGVKRLTKQVLKEAENILRGEIKTYDTFLRGDIVGYEVEKNGEFIDSCWGFYEEETAILEAEGTIDWQIKDEQKEHETKLKQQIRAGVPLQYR